MSNPIPTIENGAVALLCDFLDAKPRPEVRWYMNNVTMISESGVDILFLENGRYLFIARLTSAQRSASFHCEVVNANLDPNTPQRSPTTYTLSADLSPGELHLYRNETTVRGLKGEDVRFVYAAAFRTSGGASILILQCPPDVDTDGNTLVIQFNNLQNSGMTTCNLVGTTLVTVPTVELAIEVLGKDNGINR